MNKKLFLTVLLMLTVVSHNAQDVLITQKGDPLKVYEVEISTSSIFYKLENKADATLHKMNKSDVLMIKYQDGRKVVVGEEKNSVPANGTVETKTEYTTSQTPSPEIVKRNMEWIEEYNNKNTFEYVKPKSKRAKGLLCVFGYKKSSILFTDDIRIEIDFGKIFPSDNKFYIIGDMSYNLAMEVKIANTSDKIIYLDLGNSFFTQFNGESVTMYTPTATTTSSSKSGGIGVNLGAVSNALGIGGALGSLSQGVNVGGGTTSGTSNVTYSQRIIAVPAKSSKIINNWYLFNDREKINFFEYYPRFKDEKYLCSYKDINMDEKLSYTEDEAPLQLSVLVSYSNEENCAKLKTLNAQIYLKEALGIPFKTMNYSTSFKAITPKPDETDAMYFFSKNKRKSATGFINNFVSQ